ncbi:hypothetical protein ACO0LC_10785 [Undibacterium sp. JH2W]|uniref:hypothetical protein n=1 Tax=Undibacterium sp. JH2W TaxID=3413037 RepID=UPI003BF1B58E
MPTLSPVYLHSIDEPVRYYYDTNLAGASGWSEGQIFFQAYTTQEPGTVAIYRHFAKDPDRYYYDTNLHNNAGWSEGSIAFYAYEQQQGNTVPIYRHNAPDPDRYYYDTNPQNHSGWGDGTIAFYAYPQGWMSAIDDNALLAHVSLPGTHETMSHYGYGSDCQQWTLAEQLQQGLRVFDIRLRYLEGDDGKVNFAIHHGNDYQYAFLDSQFPYTDDAKYFVLDDCLAFLKNNPTECIVLLMKQEKSAQERGLFYDAFWEIIDKRDGYNGKTLDQLFYKEHTPPKMRDARGKIIFAFVDGDDGADYQLISPERGLYWGNIDYQVQWNRVLPGQQPGLDVENHWKDFKDAKWSRIEKHLYKALDTGTAATVWYVIYTSASRAPEVGYFPGDYASYLLPQLQDYLYTNSINKPHDNWGIYFGTVLMDFPSKEVISLLIRAALKYQYA